MNIPEYIRYHVQFQCDKSLYHIRRVGDRLLLPKKAYRAMIKKHDCAWLDKFRSFRQEVGKIQFTENGVEYEGQYAFWAKDWSCHMTKPIDKWLGRHMMYMIPMTFFDERGNVYAKIRSAMMMAVEENYERKKYIAF